MGGESKEPSPAPRCPKGRPVHVGGQTAGRGGMRSSGITLSPTNLSCRECAWGAPSSYPLVNRLVPTGNLPRRNEPRAASRLSAATMVASSGKQPTPPAMECGFGKKKARTPPPHPPIINNILIINDINNNNNNTSSSRGRPVLSGPRRPRKAAAREGAARCLPTRPGRGGTGGHRGPPAGYQGAAASRRAAESGRIRSPPFRTAPRRSARLPGRRDGRCPLRTAPRRTAPLRAPGPRRGAKGGGESCTPSRCERHQLPCRGLFLAERRRLPSQAIRHSLLPPSPLHGAQRRL